MSTARWVVRFVANCLAGLVCVLLAGCLVPYMYPHLQHVSGFQVPKEGSELYAFRVEASNVIDAGQARPHFMLARLSLDRGEHVPAQTDLTLDYGAFIGGAMQNPVHQGHSLSVRLYRPGYRLMEIRAGEPARKIAWQAVEGLEGEEEVLDSLLGLPSLEIPMMLGQKPLPAPVPSKGWMALDLTPGSAGAQHRDSLLFVATEYERLARKVPDYLPLTEGRGRLLKKARDLKERANQ
jgi:hypothetical protein